ncbi:MAG TPA: peptidoglycan DD-metalloendopeptidase family protein [Bacteroidales bacterium]|nr:peptidoglycan DD-metalloendopeptidase family protein [Bacteroidales bacterium]
MNFYQKLLEINKELHPLFVPDLDATNTFFLDFSATNRNIQHLDFSNPSQVNALVEELLRDNGKKYGYGGYLENRNLYRCSELFMSQNDEARNIHLGVDIWTEAGGQVYSPLKGVVHSFRNNDRIGDYGPTIILEHNLAECIFYTLYGHLSQKSLEGLFQGKIIEKGEPFCSIGNFPENGNWPPHLHFQVIGELMGMQGDFPGVCHCHEKEKFELNCPDPIVFFDKINQ